MSINSDINELKLTKLPIDSSLNTTSSIIPKDSKFYALSLFNEGLKSQKRTYELDLNKSYNKFLKFSNTEEDFVENSNKVIIALNYTEPEDTKDESEDTEADVIDDKSDTVYTYTDSDIYTNFNGLKTLTIRQILKKIKNGEKTGVYCLGNRCHSYGRITSTPDIFPLYNDIQDIFNQSGTSNSVARSLINSEVVYYNDSRTYLYLARVESEYYLISSNNESQQYSWKKLNISQEYIQLYMSSDIMEKIKYAIGQIKKGLPSFRLLTNSKSYWRNIKVLDTNVEINSENIDTECSKLTDKDCLINFIWTNTIDGFKFKIWVDHNKLFGWNIFRVLKKN